MLFSSMTFLCVFLPLVLGLYYMAKTTARNWVLLVASLIFYAWGGLNFLWIMLAIIAFAYFGAIAIEKWHKRGIIAVFILLIFGFLIYFKYANFIGTNMGFNMAKVILPIGISFYVFQAVSYLVDVWRGEVKAQKNPAKLALFISLFPALIAGPILKYHDIAGQIEKRETKFDDFVAGAKRFIIGLGKKVLIANSCGIIADAVFGQSISGFGIGIAWLGAIAYSLQLFFDFSGYSDMAIGIGRMFGFKLLENFNYPYISKSITEFWRRWHISLSTWFKEYLYIPLGGNRMSKSRNYINLFIVFLATGIWHGAAWTFIVWGIWHGIFIIFEKATGLNKDSESHAREFLRRILTIFVFIIGWVIFRAPNLKYAGNFISKMFGFGQTNITTNLPTFIDTIPIVAILIGILLSIPLFRNLLNRQNHVSINIGLIVLLVLSMASISASSFNPFIYFQF